MRWCSTSAIHHLLPEEKRQVLFGEIHEILPAGGVFINGDETRPAGDAKCQLAARSVAQSHAGRRGEWRHPGDFRRDRGEMDAAEISTRFGAAFQSGNDCLETVETQVGYLAHGRVRRGGRAVEPGTCWCIFVACRG